MGGGKGKSMTWTALGNESIGRSKPEKEETKSTDLHYSRTEFVVLFIWREPTESSDSLLTKKEEGGEQSGGGGMPGGGPGK